MNFMHHGIYIVTDVTKNYLKHNLLTQLKSVYNKNTYALSFIFIKSERRMTQSQWMSYMMDILIQGNVIRISAIYISTFI